jgi:DNA-binding NtrC family response regulator
MGGQDETLPLEKQVGSLTDTGEDRLSPRLELLVGGPVPLAPIPLVPGKTYLVGRQGDAEIRIDHPHVSRQHAKITIDLSRTIQVTDLGGINGTRVAGRALHMDSAPLRPGDLVQVGSSTLLVASTPFFEGSPMWQVYERALDAARSETIKVILILGEHGVGKSWLAPLIHQSWSRRTKPLLRVDLASRTTNVDDELFGHAKGAFTGAESARPGVFEEVSGGTIHLDEVGDLSLDLQPRLLTVLQEGKVTRLGENQPRDVDVRVIASTNRDLKGMLASGRFREDLFFRLEEFTVNVPPLRERPTEIVPLAREMLLRLSATDRRTSISDFSPGAIARLTSYEWPGNVRELEHAVKRARINSKGQSIEARHLDLTGPVSGTPALGDGPTDTDLSVLSSEQLQQRATIVALQKKHRENVEAIYKELGIGRTNYYNLLKELHLPTRKEQRKAANKP